MSTEHLGELADLYAMGSLDDATARDVERHVQTCEPCAQDVAAASDAVAHIESARPLVTPPRALQRRLAASTRKPSRAAHGWITGLAVAAAFAIGLIPSWVAVDRSRQAAATADEIALARLASAEPMQHAAFMASGRAVGNVIYGTRGNWYYILVMHPKPDMQVAYVHNGTREMLGRLVMHGNSGRLYLPIDHKMDELALMEGNQVVADAHLIY